MDIAERLLAQYRPEVEALLQAESPWLQATAAYVQAYREMWDSGVKESRGRSASACCTAGLASGWAGA